MPSGFTTVGDHVCTKISQAQEFLGPPKSKKKPSAEIISSRALHHANHLVCFKNIFMVGFSGYGYAVLAVYLQTRYPIKVFQVWTSISDLVAWYHQLRYRNPYYARHILQWISSGEQLDETEASNQLKGQQMPLRDEGQYFLARHIPGYSTWYF